MLSFENAPLADAVAAANRYNVQRIILVDATSREFRFTGTFRATDAAGLAQMLAATFRLKLSRDKTGNFLLSETVGYQCARHENNFLGFATPRLSNPPNNAAYFTPTGSG